MVSSQLCCFSRQKKKDRGSVEPHYSLVDYRTHRSTMGAGMSEIIPGLYVGNFSDAKDQEALHANRITHVLTIHDHPKPNLPNVEQLCLNSSDTPNQNISQFFHKSTEFIHECRLRKGSVLVHCIAGVSRSVTLAVAYMMSTTDYGWRDCLRAAKQARQVANPNFGFQKQLQSFEKTELDEVRKRLRDAYPDTLREQDNAAIQQLLDKCNQKPASTTCCPDDEFYPLPHNAYSLSPDLPPPQ